MIKAGQTIKLKAEWMDAGDERVIFVAVENQDGGCVLVQAQLGMRFNPTQVVRVDMIEEGAAK